MAASTPGILRLPPEIMLKIAEYLPPDDNLSLKSAHSTLHTTVPPVRLYRHRKFPHCSTTLPPELIYEIADYLPPDCILALKLTHPILNATLPLTRWINRTPPSKCARLSIRTYLSKPVPRPSHIRCILCKNVYPAAIFSSSSSPACLPVSVTNGLPHPEVIDLPQRFCSWHVGRLTKIIHTGSGGRNEWISTMKDMCMHCGSVRGWSDCSCQCGSCGIRSVRVYTRYLNNKVECKRFWFWRNTETAMVAQGQDGIQGQLFVRESCFDPDATECTSVINLPVHFTENSTTHGEHATKYRGCPVRSRPQHSQPLSPVPSNNSQETPSALKHTISCGIWP